MKLAIIIPVYNEEKTIEKVIQDVFAACQLLNHEFRVVVVDDASTDRTFEIAEKLINKNIQVCSHGKNTGKGGCIAGVLDSINEDEIIIIQDADLEYSPCDYVNLLRPFEIWNADVVYGSRFLGAPHRVMFFWHYFGNRLLTLLTNVVCDLNLTDMETGAKAFRASVLRKIKLKEKRFGFEPEVTIKLAKAGVKFYEVPVSYNGRDYSEGKKIEWLDGLKAIWYIIKYRFSS